MPARRCVELFADTVPDTNLKRDATTAAEIEQAARFALDFIVLGPLLSTPTHPNAPILGWAAFTVSSTAISWRRPASLEHNQITFNIAADLGAQLPGSPCTAYVSDLRVKVAATGLHAYPDVVALCGEAIFDDGVMDTLLTLR